MSSTTSDTSAIDDKKDDNSQKSSNSFASDLVSFLISMVISILIILLYFSSSGLILFVCKLAQSNILPTEPECSPYTNNAPIIKPIQTNIFPTSTDPEMSMKLEFPYDSYNSSNKLLDMFRTYKEKSNSNFLANYFISIIEQLICFNYSSINMVMNGLNGLPETLLVALGPLIISFLFIGMLIVNIIYTIYAWFANMSWFFKKNTNDTGDGLPKWEDIGITSPIDMGLGIGLVILFIILFFLGSGLLLTFIPYAILLFCIITAISYKAMLNGKKATSITIIKDVLKYYKLSIFILFSTFMVLLSLSKLGIIMGAVSIVFVILVYFHGISMDAFKPIEETNLTPSVSYNQAIKKCSAISKGVKHGFLYNLLLGQKGGNITKELKKISKLNG